MTLNMGSCGTSPLTPMKRKASVKVWKTSKMEKFGLRVEFFAEFEARHGIRKQASGHLPRRIRH